MPSAPQPDWAWSDIRHVIEIRGLYDGWSIAVLNDGRVMNRWPEGDRRHKPTQDYIERLAREGGM